MTDLHLSVLHNDHYLRPTLPSYMLYGGDELPPEAYCPRCLRIDAQGDTRHASIMRWVGASIDGEHYPAAVHCATCLPKQLLAASGFAPGYLSADGRRIDVPPIHVAALIAELHVFALAPYIGPEEENPQGYRGILPLNHPDVVRHLAHRFGREYHLPDWHTVRQYQPLTQAAVQLVRLRRTSSALKAYDERRLAALEELRAQVRARYTISIVDALDEHVALHGYTPDELQYPRLRRLYEHYQQTYLRKESPAVSPPGAPPDEPRKTVFSRPHRLGVCTPEDVHATLLAEIADHLKELATFADTPTLLSLEGLLAMIREPGAPDDPRTRTLTGALRTMAVKKKYLARRAKQRQKPKR